MTAPVPADVLSRLKAVLGDGGWSQDPERLAPKLLEWRDRWSGQTPFLALPRTTADVAAVVGICAESATPITTQGGNTGLVGGQIPQGEVLLSTERLRAIRETDTFDDVLVAEAGVTLSAVHAAAAAVGRRFPLGLASEGSATVGGVVSTNAGARTATVSRPARARSQTAAASATGRTKVRGPGQKAAARRSPRSSNRAIRRAAATSATWAISGLKLGRPLAS
jgi:hypothetical protein